MYIPGCEVSELFECVSEIMRALWYVWVLFPRMKDFWLGCGCIFQDVSCLICLGVNVQSVRFLLCCGYTSNDIKFWSTCGYISQCMSSLICLSLYATEFEVFLLGCMSRVWSPYLFWGLIPLLAQVVNNLPTNAGDTRDSGSIPGSGRSPGGGNDNPLQDFCLENPMDRGAWQATVYRVTKSQTRLKRLSTHPWILELWSLCRCLCLCMSSLICLWYMSQDMRSLSSLWIYCPGYYIYQIFWCGFLRV